MSYPNPTNEQAVINCNILQHYPTLSSFSVYQFLLHYLLLRIFELAITHSLSPLLPAAHAGSLSSPSLQSRPQTPPIILEVPPINRRKIVVGLGGALWSWNALNGKEEAMAAARRPPPPPTGEKKDPTVSGLQAKVLASKKRKEAMKASLAKLREKGKPVVEKNPSSSSSSDSSSDQ